MTRLLFDRRAALVLALMLTAPAARADAPTPPTMTLDDALKQLDANNLTLAQARGRASEAGGIVRQAMAGLLPTLAVGGSYTRNNAEAKLSMNALLDSIEGGISKLSPVPVALDRSNVPKDGIIQPLESWTGQAALRVPLFAANAWPDYLATREAKQAAELSVEAARLQLRAVLVQAATWATAAEEISQASQRALDIAKAHEQSAQRAVIAGTATPLSHLQAKTEVVRRESDVVRTRAELEKAWLALGVLLGKPEPVRVAVPEPESAPALPALEGQLSDALVVRPDLLATSHQVEAAEWQVSSAWWRLAPTVSASFAVVGSNVNYVTGLPYGWKASVDLTWALYDGGFRYGKRQQAEAQRATARAALESAQLQVRQEVLDARRDLEVAAQRLALAKQQKALAEEAEKTADRSFEAGLISSLDVLDANDKLYLAEVGLADARAKVGMATAALAKATGALLEPSKN